MPISKAVPIRYLKSKRYLALDPDLLFYSDMETRTGENDIVDFSGNGNNGTMVGTIDAPGVFGRARDFNDATDTYITVVDDPSLDGFRTVAFWFHPEDGHSSSSARRYMFNHRDNTGDFPGMQILLHESGYLFILDDPGAGAATSAQTTQTSWTDTFHHVACVADDTDMTIYINGVQDGQTPFTTAFTDSVNLAIGVTTNLSSTQSMDGVIDEVLILSRALSASEVLRLYETGLITVADSW